MVCFNPKKNPLIFGSDTSHVDPEFLKDSISWQRFGFRSTTFLVNYTVELLMYYLEGERLFIDVKWLAWGMVKLMEIQRKTP